MKFVFIRYYDQYVLHYPYNCFLVASDQISSIDVLYDDFICIRFKHMGKIEGVKEKKFCLWEFTFTSFHENVDYQVINIFQDHEVREEHEKYLQNISKPSPLNVINPFDPKDV